MALFSTSVLSITDAQLKKELGDYLTSNNSPVMQSESVDSALEFLTTVISRNFHIEQISAYQVNEFVTHVGIVINNFLQNATSNAPENNISDPFDTLLNGGNALNAALSNNPFFRPFFLRPELLQHPAENLPMPYQGVLPQQLLPLQALSQIPGPPYQQLPPQQALFQFQRPPHQLPQAVFAQVRAPLPLHVYPARPGIRGLHQRNNNFIEAGQPIEVEATPEETEKTKKLKDLEKKNFSLKRQQQKLKDEIEQVKREKTVNEAEKTVQLNKLAEQIKRLEQQQKKLESKAEQLERENAKKTKELKDLAKKTEQLEKLSGKKIKLKEQNKQSQEGSNQNKEKPPHKATYDQQKPKESNSQRTSSDREVQKLMGEIERNDREEKEKREQELQQITARKKVEEEERQRQRQELARKKAEEEEKRRQEELARKRREKEKQRQEWLARKKAERERQQQEKLARKKAKKEKERQEREQAQCQSPQKEQTNELLNTADLYNLRGAPANLAIVSDSPYPSMENLQCLQKHFPDKIKEIRQNIIKKNKNQPDKRSAQEESAKSNVLGDNTKSSEDVSQSNRIISNRRWLEKSTLLDKIVVVTTAVWAGAGLGYLYRFYQSSQYDHSENMTRDECQLFLNKIFSDGDGYIIKDSKATVDCIVRLSENNLTIPVYKSYISDNSNGSSDFILYEPSGNNVVPNEKFFLAPAKMEKLSDISSEFGERYAVFLSNIHELLLNRSLTDGVRITNISAILCGVMPTKDLTEKCFLNVRDMIESFGIHAISSYYSFINAGHYDFKHYISQKNIFVILPFWEVDADKNLVGRRYPVRWQENSYRPLFPLFDIPPDEQIDPYTQGKTFFFNKDLKWIRHTNAFLSGQKTGLSQLKHFVAYESLPCKRYARIIGYDDGKQLHLAWEPDHGLRESHAAFMYMIYKHYLDSSQQFRKMPEELNAWFTSCLKSQACQIPWLRSDVTKLDNGYFQRVHKTYEIKAMSSGKIMRQWQKQLAFIYAASNLHSTGLTISQFADKARKLCGVLEHKKSQLACFLELADAHFSKLNWTKSPEILHYLENFDEYSPKIIWPKNNEYSVLPPGVLTPL